MSSRMYGNALVWKSQSKHGELKSKILTNWFGTQYIVI